MIAKVMRRFDDVTPSNSLANVLTLRDASSEQLVLDLELEKDLFFVRSVLPDPIPPSSFINLLLGKLNGLTVRSSREKPYEKQCRTEAHNYNNTTYNYPKKILHVAPLFHILLPKAVRRLEV